MMCIVRIWLKQYPMNGSANTYTIRVQYNMLYVFAYAGLYILILLVECDLLSYLFCFLGECHLHYITIHSLPVGKMRCFALPLCMHCLSLSYILPIFAIALMQHYALVQYFINVNDGEALVRADNLC